MLLRLLGSGHVCGTYRLVQCLGLGCLVQKMNGVTSRGTICSRRAKKFSESLTLKSTPDSESLSLPGQTTPIQESDATSPRETSCHVQLFQV